MTRDEMIRLLVLDRLEHRDELTRYMHLQRVLENGFRGFRNMTDRELQAEVRALGLDVRAGGGQDDVFDVGMEEIDEDYAFDAMLAISNGARADRSGEYSQ